MAEIRATLQDPQRLQEARMVGIIFPFSSPVCPLEKANWIMLLVVDYHKLNQALIPTTAAVSDAVSLFTTTDQHGLWHLV